MNYFAHGLQYLHQPYRLAGTALPDWLNVVDRRVRVRRRHAEPFQNDADPRAVELAAGVLQHHKDDEWFHGTATFVQLCAKTTVLLRNSLPTDDSMRIGFLGHILVEILLDATLIDRNPGQLDQYYETIGRLDAPYVQDCLFRMTGKEVPTLAAWVHRFGEVQFLRDYATDERLLFRLNQIMQRVGLQLLPRELLQVLPHVRESVAEHCDALLTPSWVTPLAKSTNSSTCEDRALCNLA